MRTFDVYLNGRRLCTAGIGAAGVVTTALTWVADSGGKVEDMDLRVCGLISRTGTHVDWARRMLKDGDEVRLVVGRKAKVSKPIRTRRESEQRRRKRRIASLQRLAQELDFEVVPRSPATERRGR